MSTNIQVLPGKVGISNTSPIHTLDVGSNVYVDDTAENKLTVEGKIYTTDITVASNLTVMGTTTVVNTENLSIKDPIIELARDSIGTGDTGILMKRAANESNVAVFYDEGAGFKISHTMSGANGTQIAVDTANALPINLYGNVTVTSNLEVGTANLFVDTTTGNVGVGTTNPLYSLDVHGTANVGALTATTGTFSGDVQLNDIFTINSSVGNIKKKIFTHYNNNASTRYWKVASGNYDGTRRNQIKMVVNIQRVDSPTSTHRLVMGADVGTLTFLPCIDEQSFYPRDLRVYKNTSDTTFDIYIQASSYTYVEVDVLYSGSDITLYDTPTWTTTEPTTSGTYTLEFTNGNLNAMKIDNNGNVGIGTTNPTSSLHVTNQGGTFNLGGSLRNQYNSVGVTAASVTGGYNTGSGPTNNGDGSYTWTLGGGDTNGSINLGYTATTNEQIKITFTAKTTDTTSPTFTFENPSFNVIGGSQTLTANYVTYTIYATLPSNGGGLLFFRVYADNITWNALTIERADVFSGGNVGIGNTNPSFPLTIGTTDGNKILFNEYLSTPGHNITCSSGWQWNFNAARSGQNDDAKITFNISGSSGYDEIMRVNSTGVGIGTASPAAKLHVQGPSGVNIIATESIPTRILHAVTQVNTSLPITWTNSGFDVYNDTGYDAYLVVRYTDVGNGTAYFYTYAGSFQATYTIPSDGRLTVRKIGAVPTGSRVHIKNLAGNTLTYTITEIRWVPVHKFEGDGTRFQGGIAGQTLILGSYSEFSESALMFRTSFDDAPKTAIIAKGDEGWSRSSLHFCLDNTLNNGVDYSADTQINTRMIIKPNGYVGIGTTNPTAGLVYRQPNLTYNASTGGGFRFIQQNTSNYWDIGVVSSTNTNFALSYNGNSKGYFSSSGSNTLQNFTGQHRTFIKDIPFTRVEELEGLIVSSDQNKYIKMSGGIEAGSNAITTNESLPVVSLSTKANDKKCFGVISASEDPETREDAFGSFVTPYEKELGDTRVYINSVGEGAMWVTDTNGPLESGDYITTSNVPGYGQKQDSEFLANYTVAKITMDCDFAPATQPIQQIIKELANVNYWVKTTYSNVSVEEYSNLAEENRTMEDETYYTKDVERKFTYKPTITVTAEDQWDDVSIIPSDVTYAEWSNLEANVQNTYTLTYTQNDFESMRYEKTTVSNVTSEDEWDEVHVEPPTVTYAEYSNLEANVQNTFTLTYTKSVTTTTSPAYYSNLTPEEQNTYTLVYTKTVTENVEVGTEGADAHVRTIYKKIEREEIKTEPTEDVDAWVLDVREELVNALDEHGQLQWEDHPTETEKAYKIRYLNASGAQTDEANCVHKAAFVGVTYHCG
jgi:hypothetical protein